jgi:hypothetical protein
MSQFLTHGTRHEGSAARAPAPKDIRSGCYGNVRGAAPRGDNRRQRLCISCATCSTFCNSILLQQLRLKRSYARLFEVTVLFLYAVSKSATPRHRIAFGRAGDSASRLLGLARLGQLLADFVAASVQIPSPSICSDSLCNHL